VESIKVGFFGDGPWAHDALKRLLTDQAIELTFVCARFDTPDDFLLELARSNNLAGVTLKNVNSEESLSVLRGFKSDIFVSMSFNQIFKEDILMVPPLGIINCHAGKLPFYRGRNILNWALINGESEFAITVHRVDAGIDTGDIILQKTFPISDDDDYGSLLRIAHLECAPLLIEAIGQIRTGTSKPVPQIQIHPIGTYFPRRIEGDELIDWNQTSLEIFNFIRAISNPGPQAQTKWNEKTVKINSSKLLDEAPIFKGVPGSVIGISEAGIYVKTSNSVLLLTGYSENFKPKLGDRLK
jgi:methionyl-tRNA formyltransferase